MNMTAIAIVAICAWALVSVVNAAKDKSKSKKNSKVDEAMQAEMAALRERIEVLEKNRDRRKLRSQKTVQRSGKRQSRLIEHALKSRLLGQEAFTNKRQ